MQRAVAVLLATLLVLGAVAQLLLGYLLLTFCDENCEPTTRWDGRPSPVVIALVLGAAVVVTGTSLVFWCFVAFNKPAPATVALIVEFAVALAILLFWLAGTQHSDGML